MSQDDNDEWGAYVDDPAGGGTGGQAAEQPPPATEPAPAARPAAATTPPRPPSPRPSLSLGSLSASPWLQGRRRWVIAIVILAIAGGIYDLASGGTTYPASVRSEFLSGCEVGAAKCNCLLSYSEAHVSAATFEAALAARENGSTVTPTWFAAAESSCQVSA